MDLYHRLSGFELRLPPLRARRDDIPSLAEFFLLEAAAELGAPRRLSPAALSRLCEHHWPGNVRELRNVIRRAAFLCDGPDGLLEPEALELAPAVGGPPLVSGAAEADAPGPTRAVPPRPGRPHSPDWGADGGGDLLSLRGRSYEELQKEIFLWALRENGGSRRKAARALGISRSTFCDRVKRLGLRVAGAAGPAIEITG